MAKEKAKTEDKMEGTKENGNNAGKENIMRAVKLEKVVLNVGGTAEKLDKGFILLEKISGRKVVKIKAIKRIPTWGVRPGLEVGAKVTIRGKDAEKLLFKILPGVNNILKEKQVRKNTVSFGIPEYIEIPGVEYIREVGIMGFEVTATFTRAGKRVGLKKTKRGKARKMDVTPEEIEAFMSTKFNTKVARRQR